MEGGCRSGVHNLYRIDQGIVGEAEPLGPLTIESRARIVSVAAGLRARLYNFLHPYPYFLLGLRLYVKSSLASLQTLRNSDIVRNAPFLLPFQTIGNTMPGEKSLRSRLLIRTNRDARSQCGSHGGQALGTTDGNGE